MTEERSVPSRLRLRLSAPALDRGLEALSDPASPVVGAALLVALGGFLDQVWLVWLALGLLGGHSLSESV